MKAVHTPVCHPLEINFKMGEAKRSRMNYRQLDSASRYGSSLAVKLLFDHPSHLC